MEKDAHAEGYEAYLLGVDESRNPYDPVDDEDDYLSWNDGWSDAETDDDHEG